MSRSLPKTADQVVVAVNPKAGARSSHDRVARLAERLAHRGLHATVLTDLGEVAELSCRLHGDGRLRALVAVGGDGTAAELVNRTTPGVPLALLPSGNENLLARYVGVTRSPDDLCETIVAGRLLALDAARANGRIFLLMLGCGFDAEVVYCVHQRRTGHIRSLDYVKPIFDVVRRYNYPALKVRTYDAAAGSPEDLAFRWLFVFNLPCYAGGLPIAPGASGSDGRLDVCGFTQGGVWKGLGYAAAIAARRHQRSTDWRHVAAGRLTITADVPVHYQLDGDPGGMLPVDVEVLPQRLTLIVSPGCRIGQAKEQSSHPPRDMGNGPQMNTDGHR